MHNIMTNINVMRMNLNVTPAYHIINVTLAYHMDIINVMRTMDSISEICVRLVAQCGAAKFSKKTKQKNVSYCIKLKSSIVCVFLPALQVYLGCQRRFWMLFLTYLNKTLFFASSIYGNDRQSRFFIFYYTKSKMAFKITFCIIRKLVKRLKIRLLNIFGVFF